MALHSLTYQHDHNMNAKLFFKLNQVSHHIFLLVTFYESIVLITLKFILFFPHTKNVMATLYRFESQYIKQKY